MDKWVQFIAALTGLIGVISGSAISYQSLRHASKHDRFKVRVKIQESTLAWPQPGTPRPKFQKNMLTYNLANTGHREFTVVSLGLEIGRRSGGLYINDPIGTVKTPYVLKPGETCAFWSDFPSIKKKVKKPKLYSNILIRAYVSDYMGNVFKSNWVKISFKVTRRERWVERVTSSFHNIKVLLSP